MKVALALLAFFCLAACSSPPTQRQSRVMPAGEKASVGHLTFSLVDSQSVPRLGDDPATARLPKNRFFIVQVAVSNSGNDEASIPGMSLVDDAGNVYPELADGAGVQNWLGMIRKVGPAQTEQGHILFDAPLGHMKLKLTEETDESDVFMDMPLNLIHEQMNDSSVPAAALPETAAPVAPAKKK